MKYLIGFVTGAIFGAAVALLYAPMTGEEMRGNIRTEADARYHQLEDQWQHGVTEIQNRLDKINADLKASIDQLRKQETESPAEAGE